MPIIHVTVHVKPDTVDAFIDATLTNARASRTEPGCTQFDVFQQQDDATRFLLIEAYRAADDVARHKETAHYLAWRDTVAPMMAEPRSGITYRELSTT